jgi:NitT/TauT family transport system permease protein
MTEAQAPTAVAPATPVTEEPGPRRFRSQPWHDRAFTFLIVVVLLTAAEIGSRSGIVSPIMLPAPSDVAGALQDVFVTGTIWPHLTSTLLATIEGFAVAVVVGFVLGGLLAVFHRLERICYPFVVAFQTLPKIAIAPLIIIWFGFGNLSKVTIVAIVAFFPILVNTLQGLRLRDRNQYELMLGLGATKWQVFRYIRFPSSLPYVFAGLHVGVIFALIGTVAAEFVGSSEGLGVLLIQQKALFNVPGVYAMLVIFMVIGLVMHGVMEMVERRVTFWAQEDRSVVAA